MALSTLALFLLLAQIGGQYPGQYPPGGGYPGGGGGIPFPRRGKKTTSESKDATAPTLYFKGPVRELNENSLELEAEDTRLITIQFNAKAEKPKGLAVGDIVDVSAKEDGKGGFIADSIKVLEKATRKNEASGTAGQAEVGGPEDRDPSATVLRGPKYDQGDTGPPVLKRGKPAPRRNAEPVEVAEASVNPPAPTSRREERPVVVQTPANPRMAFIDRAREAAQNFLTGLPNYVCQEHTTRYQSEGKSGWHALDLVSVDLIYEDGKEKYQNLAINGKPSKKPAEESGAWSTGEFGTVLNDLFSPATAAKFKYIRDATASGLNASVYDFTVDHEHSHWKVTMVGQTVFPAYKGSIWLDKESARALRIEMQATNIPSEFPEDSVESAVDYGYISLGVQKFFLPTQAEVLSCHRGTSVCDRNVIEFRNYHRYSGESNITFK